MKTSSKMMFMSLSIMSTMLALSSSNWMNMWIGMEINLMSFIPMMSKSTDKTSSSTLMTYFLSQSMASAMFIISMLLMKHTNNYQNISQIIMPMTMMMKLGIPPFHQWFVEVMNKLPWNMAMFLMSWQKLAPMYVLSNLMSNMTLTFMIAASATGSIFGINQTSTRKIMAYSSMNHMGWMMACAKIFKKSWMLYLMMYTLIMVMFLKMLKDFNIKHMNQFTFMLKTSTEKMSFMVAMMSMGGLPPFLGFMPKWLMILNMMSMKEFMIMLMVIMSTIITLMYYLWMISSCLLMNNQSQKWTMSLKTTKISSMNLTMNMLLPTLMLLLNML